MQAPEDDPGRFRVGVDLGIVSLPRPVLIEGYARVHPYLGIAGNWSYFPKFASDALLNWAGAQSDTTKGELNDFSGWEVALRVYPLRGTFYVGVGFGHQNLEANGDREPRAGFTGVGVRAGGELGDHPAHRLAVGVAERLRRRGGPGRAGDGGAHRHGGAAASGTPADVEQDVRDLVHFGVLGAAPVLSFRIGYHFG